MSTGVDCISSISNLSNIAVSGGSKNLKVGNDTMVQCNLCGVQVSLKKLRQHKNLKCQACGHHHLHHGTVAEPRKSNPKLVMRTKKIFVGGLSATTSLEDIKAYFEQFSKVKESMLAYNRGFGFVTFDNEDVVDKICEIHFHKINGKMVESKKALPKELRGGGGGMTNLYSSLSPPHSQISSTRYNNNNNCVYCIKRCKKCGPFHGKLHRIQDWQRCDCGHYHAKGSVCSSGENHSDSNSTVQSMVSKKCVELSRITS